MIKEPLSYQPEKMQGEIPARSFSQGTHLKTFGKLTKKLGIAYEGKHAKQVPLSILILTVSLRENSQMTVTQTDLSAVDYYEPGTGFQLEPVT